MEKPPLSRNQQSRLPLLITNNRLCVEAFYSRCTCLFEESWSYEHVLTAARDAIHQGYHLLNHPQSGSLKPNQTPYRTLLLSQYSPDSQEQFTSLLLIEQALAAYAKFQKMRPTPPWPDKVLDDFRIADLSLMQVVFERSQLR